MAAADSAVRFRLFVAGSLPPELVGRLVEHLGPMRAVYPQIK